MLAFKTILCILIILFLQSSAESKLKNLTTNAPNFYFNSSVSTSCACLNTSQFLNILVNTGKGIVQQLKKCRKIELQKTLLLLFQSICEYSCDLTSFSKSCANELHPFLKKEARENFTYTTWNIFIKNLDAENINYNEMHNPCVLYGSIYSSLTLLLQHSKNAPYLFKMPFCSKQDYSCSESVYLWEAIPQK